MNFVVTKNGPVVPPDVNPKFFNSIKIAPMGHEKFKAGNVSFPFKNKYCCAQVSVKC
jgi:hypothetical protein